MTIYDLSCDVCGRPLARPGTGVRFVYHPGVPRLLLSADVTTVSA